MNRFNFYILKLTLIHLIVIFTISYNGFTQNLKDTTFLYRKVLENSYHAIFIEKNVHSPFYNLGKQFFINYEEYSESIQQLKDSGFIVKKKHKQNFPSEWFTLYKYKNKFYAYSPSEPYMNTWLSINDTTLIINYFNDGCIPAFIQDIQWINNKTLEIKTQSLYKEDSDILIHFITKKKDVAVIEFPLRGLQNRFTLMVSEKSLKNYPIIVNYCKNYRTFEWKFDTPNYKHLLKGID